MYAKLFLLVYTLLLLFALSSSVPQWQWPNFGFGVQGSSGGSGYTCIGGYSSWCGSSWRTRITVIKRILKEIRSHLYYVVFLIIDFSNLKNFEFLFEIIFVTCIFCYLNEKNSGLFTGNFVFIHIFHTTKIRRF